jgi:arabinogalactan endo-1,4-beta-galactosidase
MVLGADMSFTSNELAVGNSFSDNGMTENPIDIMAEHGANTVRLRLWVDPPPGYSDLQTELRRWRDALWRQRHPKVAVLLPTT